MKKKIISLMIAVLAAGAFVSCSDWTEPEARDFTQHKPASYYENLRAWKADKSHPIAFGWFGGWDPTGATTATSLMGFRWWPTGRLFPLRPNRWKRSFRSRS